MTEEEETRGRVPRTVQHPTEAPLISPTDGHEFGKPRNPRVYRPSLVDWFLTKTTRTMISQNRCRFKYQGLDLDLAYITDRIIAMGYPSESLEGAIRNTMKETVEFLARRHTLPRVKVFNLRGNFFYDPKKFADNVITFDMTDHHPPKLELMAPFCREALHWLMAHPENVIAVHCKAGKGRTGVMICALLSYIEFYPSARQIIDYYSIIRTKNNKGVTIPSQRRYIYYFAKLRELKLNYFPIRMQLIGVYLECPPQTHSHKTAIKIRVANMSSMVYDPPVLEVNTEQLRVETQFWRGNHGGFPDSEADQVYNPKSCKNEGKFVAKRAYSFLVPAEHPVFVEGDVRVDMLAERDAIGCGPVTANYDKIGHVWFNTMFACSSALKVDGMKKDSEFFEYIDKAEPYPEGETSIALRDLGNNDEFEYMEGPGRTRPDIGDLKILQPPNIDRIAHPSILDRMYAKFGMENPRLENARAIHKSHAEGKVVDDYNKRRKNAERGRSPMIAARDMPDRPSQVDGPFCIRAKKGEHILTFPVYEMDRALKSKSIDDNMKIHVVLKCIDGSDTEMVEQSEVFTNTNFAKSVARANTHDAARRGFPYRYPAPRSYGAERQFPQAVRYSDRNGQYNGEPSFKKPAVIDPRSNMERWNRFFYRPRTSSPSRYKGSVHYCEAGNVSFEPKQNGRGGSGGNNPDAPGNDDDSGSSSERDSRGGGECKDRKPSDPPAPPGDAPTSSGSGRGPSGSVVSQLESLASEEQGFVHSQTPPVDKRAEKSKDTSAPTVPKPGSAAATSLETATAVPPPEDSTNEKKIVEDAEKKLAELKNCEKSFFEKFGHNLPDDINDDPNLVYQESDEYKRLVVALMDYNALPKSERQEIEEFRSDENQPGHNLYQPGHDLRYQERFNRYKCEIEEDFEQKNRDDDGSDYLTAALLNDRKKQDEAEARSRQLDADVFEYQVNLAENRETNVKPPEDKRTWKGYKDIEKKRLKDQRRDDDSARSESARSATANKFASYFKSWKFPRFRGMF